jgi:carboxylesterase
VTAAYDELRDHCDAIFPIGLSLGGLLAIHLAAHRPVNGVVAVSTPFTIRNPLIPLFKYLPFLFDLVPYIKKDPGNDDTEDQSVRARHPWYPINPTRCAANLIFDFVPQVHSDLRNVRAPALLIQARGDRVIPPDSIDQFYARLASSQKEKICLPRGGHLALEDYSKEEAFSHILRFVQANLPTQPLDALSAPRAAAELAKR